MSNIELYHTIRAKRLALQREAELLEQQEKDILYELTKSLDPKQEVYTNKFSNYVFKAKRQDAFSVVDWSATLGHIRGTGELDLLEKRLTKSAAAQRWDAGLTVPGVEKSHKWAVTVTKE